MVSRWNDRDDDDGSDCMDDDDDNDDDDEDDFGSDFIDDDDDGSVCTDDDDDNDCYNVVDDDIDSIDAIVVDDHDDDWWIHVLYIFTSYLYYYYDKYVYRNSKAGDSILVEGDDMQFKIKSYQHVNGVIHIDGIFYDDDWL